MPSLLISLVSLCLLVMLSACAPSVKINKLEEFAPVQLKVAPQTAVKVQPVEGKNRVVVWTMEDRRWPSVGENIAAQLAKELLDTGNVELIDRVLFPKMDKLLQADKPSKLTRKTDGMSAADFVLTGKFTTAEASVTYRPGGEFKDKKGEVHRISAQCNASSRVALSLKVLRLPNLELVRTLDSEARSSSSQEARLGYSCPNLTPSESKVLIDEAGSNVVQKLRTELKNQFAPTGYVQERKSRESEHIFAVSLGSTRGAKEGLVVDFYRANLQSNAAKTSSAEYKKIANGLISNQIDSSACYVLLDGKSSADEIKKGDMVRVRFEDSLLDKITNTFH